MKIKLIQEEDSVKEKQNILGEERDELGKGTLVFNGG